MNPELPRPSGISASDSSKSLAPWLMALMVLSVAIRAWHHFRTPFVPGMDGAYYLIQARSMLDRGSLHFADLPLITWIQAGFALVLERSLGMAQDPAIVFSVKLTDTVLPPLVAIPMALIGWRWFRPSGPSILASLVPAAILGMSAPIIRMLGDFQKNALALVWLALLIESTHSFLKTPGMRTAIVPTLAIFLCGLTHVGVLGAAIVFSLSLVACSCVTIDRRLLARLAILTLIGAAIVAGVALVLTSTVQTTKYQSLLKTMTSPLAKLGGMRILPAIPATFVFAIVATVAWKRRSIVPSADRALALASALSALAMVAFDQGGRLVLIAILPASVALSFLLANMENPPLSRRLGGGILAIAVISGLVMPGPRPVIESEEFAELKSLETIVSPREETMIVTEHGVEFWVAWTLHTQVSMPGAIQGKFWDEYPNVFYLERKEGARRPPRDDRPPPPRGRRGGPPGPRRSAPPKLGTIEHDGEFFKLARYPLPRPTAQ